MTREDQFERNLALSAEFDLYLMEHPEVEAGLPDEATIVFMPEYDSELRVANQKSLEARRAEGRQIVVIWVHELAPRRSRIAEPQIQLLPA